MGAGSPTKLCEICEEAGVVRLARVVNPKRLCATHYNRTRYTAAGRHPKVTVDCDWCGKPCVKGSGRAKRYGGLFCSFSCRDTWRQRDKLPVLFVGIVVRPDPIRPAEPAPRRWVAGICRHCGTAFVDRQPDARYCSDRCCRRYWRLRYKDEVPRAVRLYVMERDGWRCQICRRGIPVGLAVLEPMAATVDHIVPRSEGGTHEPANLRAAHFICNTRRNNRGGNEQLALIG